MIVVGDWFEDQRIEDLPPTYQAQYDRSVLLTPIAISIIVVGDYYNHSAIIDDPPN